MEPVKQQVVVIEHGALLLGVDVAAEQLAQLVLPVAAPRERAVLEEIIAERGVPVALTQDNGTEFTSRHYDAWAFSAGIQLDFIRPGRPVENCYIESFNGKLRDECLSQSWFLSLSEAQEQLDALRKDYNETRPHSSLGNLPPAVYVQLLQEVVAT